MVAGASTQPDPLDMVHGPCGMPNVPPGIPTTTQPMVPMMPPNVSVFDCNTFATKINMTRANSQLKDEPLIATLVQGMFDAGVVMDSVVNVTNGQTKLIDDLYQSIVALPQNLHGKGAGQSAAALRAELSTLKRARPIWGSDIQHLHAYRLQVPGDVADGHQRPACDRKGYRGSPGKVRRE